MNPLFEDPEIRRLKDELYDARRSILSLVPAIREEAHSYYRCESRSDLYKWEREIIEKVVAMAKPQANAWRERAYCPLCGDGSSSPYAEGFTLPIGLERHLEGYGQVRQCDVTKALFALARDHHEPKFTAAERIERERVQQEIAQRRTAEFLYDIDPRGEPVLSDEGYHHGKNTRDETSMTWAEQRLAGIGFTLVTMDRIKRAIYETPGFVVFADPRFTGEIASKYTRLRFLNAEIRGCECLRASPSPTHGKTT